MWLGFIQKNLRHDLFGGNPQDPTEKSIGEGRTRAHGDDGVHPCSLLEKAKDLSTNAQAIGIFVHPADGNHRILPALALPKRHVGQDGGGAIHVRGRMYKTRIENK